MSDELVLGIDCSTTACKAIAFDLLGNAQSEGRAPIALSNPEPDGYEQDAEQWWTASLSALKSALAKLDRPQRVRALCVAHQRETFVVTDTDGKPLHPALVWMDARCRTQVARLSTELGADRVHQLSGKPPSVTPSLYKLAYLLERHPELASNASLRVLDVHGFLCWRLTGSFRTSLASADPLGMVDMRRGDWAPELLEAVGLGSEQLPELVPPGTPLGALSESVARAVGLEPGLPVVAGAGDGQAAGLGAGITAPGRAYLNLGTAVVSGLLSEQYLVARELRTMQGAVPGSYFLETDLKGGTFTVSWLVDKLLGAGKHAAERLSELEQAAEALGPGSDGLMLVPYWAGVMNPYWDDAAAGITLGWHGAHRPSHVYRAILEGIALEQRLHSEGVERASGQQITEMVLMGGGSKSKLWCQILADVIQKPMVRSRTPEATALGAAVLAASGAKLYESPGLAAEQMAHTGDRFVPGANRDHYDQLYRVYVKLYPALAESLAELTRLRGASH